MSLTLKGARLYYLSRLWVLWPNMVLDTFELWFAWFIVDLFNVVGTMWDISYNYNGQVQSLKLSCEILVSLISHSYKPLWEHLSFVLCHPKTTLGQPPVAEWELPLRVNFIYFSFYLSYKNIITFLLFCPTKNWLFLYKLFF